MIQYPEIAYPIEKALSLDVFADMDNHVIENYNLSIELMMENAGLHLARLISDLATKNHTINIGIGNGNNGGGGLVAARRLAAWGFKVSLDAFTPISKYLAAIQLDRAIKFGVKTNPSKNPDIWVDAYLGFSQRFPLNKSLLSILEKINNSSALKISLDIPTGFLGNHDDPYFEADKVLTLAVPKSILFNLPLKPEIFVADIGIPQEVYHKFQTALLPFDKGDILKIKNESHG